MYQYDNTYLAHHGVKGQKWGVRRYVDENGNLTDKGRARYSGRKGLAKYISDNDPSIRKHRNIMTGAIAGLEISSTIKGVKQAKDAGVASNKTIAAVTAAGSILNAGLLWLDHNIRKSITYSMIYNSNRPAMIEKRNDAMRYLRSQGIRV